MSPWGRPSFSPGCRLPSPKQPPLPCCAAAASPDHRRFPASLPSAPRRHDSSRRCFSDRRLPRVLPPLSGTASRPAASGSTPWARVAAVGLGPPPTRSSSSPAAALDHCAATPQRHPAQPSPSLASVRRRPGSARSGAADSGLLSPAPDPQPSLPSLWAAPSSSPDAFSSLPAAASAVPASSPCWP